MELNEIMEMYEWDDEIDAEESRIQNQHVMRAPKRYIRDQQNPMEFYDENQFRRRFRFRKETVLDVLVPIIFPESDPASERGLPLPRVMKVLIALRFYATSSYQISPCHTPSHLCWTVLKFFKNTVCGDLFQVSQPSVHRIIKTVSENLCRKIAHFIQMPNTTAELHQTRMNFYRKANFPGVIGLVDGTHIPISSPGGDQAEIFRNRKGYFSLNVQIVSGPNEEIYDIVCRWPGSAHDSRVFDSSAIRVRLEEDHRRLGHLLGDAGYAQKKYIFTPLSNPTTEPERKYNKAHKTTRNAVERTIGRWKRRFPCLYYEIHTKLRTTLRIIPACAILYNIGIQASDSWPLDGDDEAFENLEVPTEPAQDVNDNGATIRRHFIIRHFS